MNDWFLGIIAISVLVMAILQLGAVIVLARAAKRVIGVTEDLQREIKPLAAKVHGIADKASAIADEAQRAAALATRQVERIDVMVADLTRRVHDTAAVVQALVTGPVKHGSAVLAGLRAVIAALLTTPPRQAADRDEEEDALFVG